MHASIRTETRLGVPPVTLQTADRPSDTGSKARAQIGRQGR